ncbi:hypothetical protein IQ241_20610 [Romeria aff. gracilis LEGE 07310]|uniref:WD40 repeat domain-containing protein n=1 Tax=Vasconcelosia minhoensis LEGE 07310 TaxID=915328 RepID=A0A8J7AIM4_9CYAN|nr:hypothetical protein [Romeria gracilis]MBE9079664.1 hypothetical protein [Romeria aff. gracilis LEGE 07310]
MPGVTQSLLERRCQGTLNDYVTAIAWAVNGKRLAIASAAGEVAFLDTETWVPVSLRGGNGQSIDCLGFSPDGRYLAAGGQTGEVMIWAIDRPPDQITTLHIPRTWIDSLTWSPTRNELAFSLGRHVQVWAADEAAVVATLPFETSSVLDLAWHPQGEHLAVSGHQGVKIWRRADWFADPEIRETAAASLAIAFSPDGQYLASGNLDRTMLVWAFDNPFPWEMRGFPGKVRHVAWSSVTVGQAPLLAAASMEAAVTWTKVSDAIDGWDAQVLDLHRERVNDIAFEPSTTLLASAAEDGWLCLWANGEQPVQILEGAPKGFTGLAWSPNGQWLAAGGQNGEWLVWTKSNRGRGFGRG